MTQRQIGNVLGIDHSTVSKTLHVSENSPMQKIKHWQKQYAKNLNFGEVCQAYVRVLDLDSLASCDTISSPASNSPPDSNLSPYQSAPLHTSTPYLQPPAR
jgi:hypothetical protein